MRLSTAVWVVLAMLSGATAEPNGSAPNTIPVWVLVRVTPFEKNIEYVTLTSEECRKQAALGNAHVRSAGRYECELTGMIR